METLSGLSKDSPEISVEGPFLLWVPAALPLHCTISSPSALKILLLPKEVCFIKEKKKIITTVWKHKALFLNCLMARCVFFFVCFLWQKRLQNIWREKQIVLEVTAPARPWEDLIWFHAPNEVENRPEHCVCDPPLHHPAAEQTEMEFCFTNSWLCTPKT